MFFGRIQWAKADSYSLVRTRTANLKVKWAGEILPPDVYVGQTVCGAGRIKTFDGGRTVYIVDAVPIPAGRKALQQFMALVGETCADPTDWAPELLDRKKPRY